MRPWIEVAAGVRVTGDGAAWLPEHAALVVADVHLGYALAARRRGGYLPSIASAEAIATRLCRMAATAGATRLVIAGDLRHSTRDVDERERAEIATFADTVRRSLMLDVVAGNHDRGGSLAGGRQLDALQLGDVAIVHAPGKQAPHSGMVICGHLHPRVTLRDGAGATARFPCALVSSRMLVLPAVSEWAGGTEVSRLVRDLPAAEWRAMPMAGGLVAEVGATYDTRAAARRHQVDA